MSQQSVPIGAVFLSYASQDAEAAGRISDALRAAGIEVWLDQSALRGGDAWDALIKKQIHECALFLPVISAHTNGRIEGYFRREWNLASRRLLDMAQDAAFLVPVVIDGTRETDARVPEEFLRAHWTRLPGGETPPAFARRVRQLLGGDGVTEHSALAATIEPGARRIISARSWPWNSGPRGTPRMWRIGLTLIVLLLVLGSIIYWRYQGGSETPPTLPTTVAASTSPKTNEDSRPSIAVLPFENRSRLEDDAFFVDGIHDDILMQLSKVRALKVISRTSVERFRESDFSIQEIAAQLGVTSILEGGVQRAGDRVRIIVQLIDARADGHLWAETYDRELTAENIFAIQTELAAAIAGALKAALTPTERARASVVPTRNLEGWEAYQLGKQRLAKRTSGGLIEAAKFFRKAIELDPKFALAHAGLADSLSLQILYGDPHVLATLEQAQTAVEVALKLDPGLSEAWASSGLVAYFRGQTDQAGKMYRRAIELDPNNATALHWYGTSLFSTGRVDEGQRALERAASLDPLSAIIQSSLADALLSQGRYSEAASRNRRAIEIDPSMPGPYWGLGYLMAYALNHFADGVPLMQKAVELDPSDPGGSIGLAILYFDLGDESKSFAMIEPAARIWPGESGIQLLLAFIKLVRLDNAGSARHAQRSFALSVSNPWALVLLRNADLQGNHYKDAIARYRKAYPELFAQGVPRLDALNYGAAVDLAVVLQRSGDIARASVLLDAAAQAIGKIPRMGGYFGHGITDVQIHALRGDTAKALAALREAERVGWRFLWRYARDFDPALASIRNEPEFKAVFADIERDMARQRAEVAGRHKATLPQDP